MRREALSAYLCVFVASFCTLVIELVAGRIMAPYVGVSLYTWTSIIGVVLAGISLGAYVGGLIADRYPHHTTLGWLLFLSGVGALSIPPLIDMIGDGGFLHNKLSIPTTLMARILIITTLVFFVPSLFLGMISPVVVKLSVTNLAKTGNIVGKIYAFSTLGSILGTFATGFFFISWMGTRTILFVMGLILALSAPLFGGFLTKRKTTLGAYIVMFALASIVLVVFFPTFWQRFHERLILKATGHYYVEESDYYTIKLFDEPRPDGRGRLEVLVLDHLHHSHTDKKDPFYLHYDYLRIYEELVGWHARNKESFNAFFIGGGGYTFPRFLELSYPNSGIDVAEIDPSVTEVAYNHLRIPRNTRIRTFNQDARWFVMNCPDKGKYDFVFGDAFNDLTVPYHLTTREFAELVKSLMKPDGIFMVNLIDNYEKGLFLPSYIRTLEEVFGTGNVVLFRHDLDMEGSSTFIVAASPRRLDMEDFVTTTDRNFQISIGLGQLLNGPCGQPPLALGTLDSDTWPLWQKSLLSSHVMPAEDLRRYLSLKEPKSVILTDDYVPVDNLLAPLFEERFGKKRTR